MLVNNADRGVYFPEIINSHLKPKSLKNENLPKLHQISPPTEITPKFSPLPKWLQNVMIISHQNAGHSNWKFVDLEILCVNYWVLYKF